jgi:hypothetical protein
LCCRTYCDSQCHGSSHSRPAYGTRRPCSKASGDTASRRRTCRACGGGCVRACVRGLWEDCAARMNRPRRLHTYHHCTPPPPHTHTPLLRLLLAPRSTHSFCCTHTAPAAAAARALDRQTQTHTHTHTLTHTLTHTHTHNQRTAQGPRSPVVQHTKSAQSGCEPAGCQLHALQLTRAELSALRERRHHQAAGAAA